MQQVTAAVHSSHTHSSPKGQGRGSITWFPKSSEAPPVVWRVELNVVWWVVMAFAFAVRFWRLDFPCYVM